MKPHTVSISVDVEDPETMARVSEQFARTLAGLAMDSIYGTLFIYEGYEEDE